MKSTSSSVESPTQHTRDRALRLRDVAMHLRDIAEGCQPETSISTVQTAGFRISYRDPVSTAQFNEARSRVARTSCSAVTIGTETTLLQMEWDGSELDVKVFQRGDWERAFLRLARSPLRQADRSRMGARARRR